MKMDPWQRLLRLARTAEQPEPPEMPYGFEKRVLRELRGAGTEPFTLLKPYLVPALLCSSIIMLLAVAFNYGVLQPDALEEATITDSLIKISLNQ